MKFKHPKGTDSPQITGIRGVFRAKPDENGVFEVDGRKVDLETMEAHGYEPLEETGDSQTPDLSAYSEEDIVTMSYRELQSIASDFEDIAGNAPKGEIEEALITRLRDDG